ncbi:MAG: energy-coupling factor transporter ATPase [Microbacterium sp.]
MTTVPSLLRVRDACVTYPDAAHAAPSGASFDVRAGEVVLLLGPSGCGKSTLTLTFNGLIPHTVDADVTGDIRVCGWSSRDHTPATLSTRVGLVFQDPDAQIVTATVFDEVAFALENLLVPVHEVLERTEHALRQLGLWARKDDDPALLSGGEKQRLAIACALATDAPLLVLDEPTANLDQAGIDDVYDALGRIAASPGHGIVLVEHNLDAAVALATRVVVLDAEGATAFDGELDAVLRENIDELERMGVWLPGALRAARQLRAAGWHIDPLPLTPGALDAALSAHEDEAPRVDNPPVEERPSAPAIRVHDLTVTKKRRTILRDVTLEVPEGSFAAIVGRNGAGKTTLAQAIAGVVPPPRGAVRVGDLDVGRASARQLAQAIGFVFQNPEHQFIAHTVFDELAHGLRLMRVPEAQVRARVDDMLVRFGLAEHRDLHPFQLSGGQKRRLSVGTVLIAEPRVLVLDEPTYGQDRARADELLSWLKRLHDEGTTILVVTHDLSLVERYATHVAVVDGGAVTAFGQASRVFDDDELMARSGLRLPELQRVLARHPRARRALP